MNSSATDTFAPRVATPHLDQAASDGITNGIALDVRGLSKRYVQQRPFGRRKATIEALADIDLAVPAGRTLALIGESGSGKSTLARCLALLERPDSGEIWFQGRNLLGLSQAELRRARRKIQLIFQDPAQALNPRLSAVELVAEPLEIARWGTREGRRQRARDLMEEVGLSRQWGNRRALEFSGGQRQRLALARALAVEARVLILDEALSALDLPLRAQMVRLLLDLQLTRGLAYLLISHDLPLVERAADQVAVMHGGRIVPGTAMWGIGLPSPFLGQELALRAADASAV